MITIFADGIICVKRTLSDGDFLPKDAFNVYAEGGFIEFTDMPLMSDCVRHKALVRDSLGDGVYDKAVEKLAFEKTVKEIGVKAVHVRGLTEVCYCTRADVEVFYALKVDGKKAALQKAVRITQNTGEDYDDVVFVNAPYGGRRRAPVFEPSYVGGGEARMMRANALCAAYPERVEDNAETFKLPFRLKSGFSVTAPLEGTQVSCSFKTVCMPFSDAAVYDVAEMSDFAPTADKCEVFTDRPQGVTALVEADGKTLATVCRRELIKVSRKLTSFEQSAATKTVTYTSTIEIKNRASSAVTLELYDRVPVSRSEKVKVTLDSSDLEVCGELGMLKADVTVPAGKTVTKVTVYTVKGE